MVGREKEQTCENEDGRCQEVSRVMTENEHESLILNKIPWGQTHCNFGVNSEEMFEMDQLLQDETGGNQVWLEIDNFKKDEKNRGFDCTSSPGFIEKCAYIDVDAKVCLDEPRIGMENQFHDVKGVVCEIVDRTVQLGVIRERMIQFWEKWEIIGGSE